MRQDFQACEQPDRIANFIVLIAVCVLRPSQNIAITPFNLQETLITLEVGLLRLPHLPGFTTQAHKLAISQQRSF